MDSESLEYTKFPAPQPQGRRTKARAALAPAGTVAAVVVVAAFLAAGTLLLPKASPVAPPATAPVTPMLEELAPTAVPIEPREARPESPLPLAYDLTEQTEPPAVNLTPGTEAPIHAVPAPGVKNVPKGRSLQPTRPLFKTVNAWSDEKETGPVNFQMGAPSAVQAPPPKGSWSSLKTSTPPRTKMQSRFIGQERPDYRVVQKERPDYRVDKKERADYRVKALAGPRLQARSADCEACEDAEDASGIVIGGRRPGGGVASGAGSGGEIGQLSYVGPCETGHVFRLTNTLGRRLGSTTLVSNSGEVWDVKALKPGESVEIRSSGMISSLSTAR